MEGLAEVSRSPKLVREIERHEGKLLPCFMEQYERLMALPRRVRKAIQRKWKHSLAGVALLLALGAAPAQAATTINVPAGDEAALIQAINDANSEVPPFDGPDTIVLANSTFTLTEVNNTTYRPTGLPVIHSAITIDGNGSTIMRMGVPFHIFAVSNSGNLTLQETTVSGGSSNLGGGVFNGGTLAITNSTISGNIGSGTYACGGGVLNSYEGTLTITNSTISGNLVFSSYTFGGGGVCNGGTLTITNSTISGNMASGGNYVDGGDGGGVSNSGTLTITNSTISDNSASDDGGGVFNAFGTVTLNRTLISGNAALTGPEIDSNDDVTADNFNLFGYSGDDGVSGFSPGATDIVPAVGLSAILDTALADNGGNTLTHALVSGSPAIDAAGPSCPPPATDQRGVTRPQGAACDIGAFELGSSPPTPTPSPSPTQTPKPTSTATPTPTATPSPEPSNNGSSGCSIAQSLESGSALANLLIPLLPIFAVGMKYLRRRVE